MIRNAVIAWSITYVFVTSCSSLPPQTSADADNPVQVTCHASVAQFQTTFLQLLNTARAQPRQCGNASHEAVPALRWNHQLLEAARRHSVDMSKNDFFSHKGSDNTSVADRVDATRYNWQSVGENLAAGQRTAREAVEGWLSSPGHCKNIMAANHTDIGIACEANQSTELRTYWTSVFGTEF